MKRLLLITLGIFIGLIVKAQTGDFEIKVISKKYQSVKGKLQKVTPEGLAIEDYKGNYLIFRTEDLVKVKIRKRGLTIGEGASAGTVAGLAVGAAIWSLDEEGQSFEDMAKLTGALTVSGAVIGTLTGVGAEIANTKLTLNIDGDANKFKKRYKKLEKYINRVPIQHVNANLIY